MVSAVPAFAGLGDAEGGSKREFDAYCGEIGKKCKVLFTEGKLIVNSKDSISKNQLVRYSTHPDFDCIVGAFSTSCRGSGSILLIYNEDGSEGSGTFIFVNRKAFEEFNRAVSAFCGGTCRPIGPSVKLEQ